MPDSLPITERRSPGSFEYCNAGALDHGGPELYLFTCWRPDHESCGTHSVYAPELASNLAALEDAGWINRTDRCEYWDWTAKCWLQGSGARRVAPNAVRPTRRPTGLPILSTEKLTAAEREAMRELRRRYQLAVATIDDCLEAGRVDRALDGLQHVASETDGLALRVIAKLGSNR